jgi:opacity protein-like surface antigen
MNGALYGAHVGYNVQKGNIVFGIEGTFDGSSIQGNTTCALILECEREVDWVATAVGRLGYAMDRSMVYAMGGGAWADLNTEVSIAGIPVLSGGETHTGWVAGFGFAYAVSDRIIARIEYSHMDFGSETHDLKLKGGGSTIKRCRCGDRYDPSRCQFEIRRLTLACWHAALRKMPRGELEPGSVEPGSFCRVGCGSVELPFSCWS